MRTDKNFPGYAYTRYDEGSKDLPTNTYAKFKATKRFQPLHTQHANLTAAMRCNAHANIKATKSFQHIHMRMLKLDHLTTFPHTHSHAKMKAAQSFQQIYTLVKLKEGQMFPIHAHTHTHASKNVDKEELFHIHAQANITASKSFTIRTLMQK